MTKTYCNSLGTDDKILNQRASVGWGRRSEFGEILEIKFTRKDLLADLAVQVVGAEVGKR